MGRIASGLDLEYIFSIKKSGFGNVQPYELNDHVYSPCRRARACAFARRATTQVEAAICAARV